MTHRLPIFSTILLVVAVCSLQGGSLVFSDQVYFTGEEEPRTGQVIEETPEGFVVRFPKDAIQRIEADQLPAKTDNAALQGKVIWQENERYITISFPKEHVARSIAETTPDAGLVTEDIPDMQAMPSMSSPFPARASMTTSTGTVQGKVVWDGQPLRNCEVRVVMVGSPSPMLRAARLLQRDQQDEPPQVSKVTRTNAHGQYTFDGIIPGEYDVYWRPAGKKGWVRRLKEYPDLLVMTGEPTSYRTIEAHVQTIN